MKKCRFCDHRYVSKDGEPICTKHIIYLNEFQEHLQCNDFSIILNERRICVISFVIFIVLGFIIGSLL